MPAGNKDLLKPLSHEDAVKNGRKGGKASGESKRKKKQLREYIEILLEREAGKDTEGNVITGAEAMAIKAVKEAMRGDWKAWELVRDTAGQKPVDKIITAEVDQETINKIEKMMEGGE